MMKLKWSYEKATHYLGRFQPAGEIEEWKVEWRGWLLRTARVLDSSKYPHPWRAYVYQPGVRGCAIGVSDFSFKNLDDARKEAIFVLRRILSRRLEDAERLARESKELYKQAMDLELGE